MGIIESLLLVLHILIVLLEKLSVYHLTSFLVWLILYALLNEL